MIKNIMEILTESIDNMWPMLTIFLVVFAVVRIAAIKSSNEKLVFYKEFSNLLFIIYILLLYELLTRAELNTVRGYNLVPFTEIFRYEIGSQVFLMNVVGNIVIFIEADKLGLKGTESSNEIDSDKELLKKIERIRGEVCCKLKLVDSWEEAQIKTPYQPFFAIVSKAADYIALNGEKVSKDNLDIVSRLLFMQKMHKTYPVTGTVATGAVARIKDSVVYNLLKDEVKTGVEVKIGHPGGIIPIKVRASYPNDRCKIEELVVCRTARLILEGRVFVNI